jgi:ligand-binding SRPBCC domain-containing protein
LSRIELTTRIRAPRERVFDLARDVDAHVASATGTDEHPVSGKGKTSGLLDLGDEVTWRARHLGITQELTSRITGFDRPRWFRDSMVRGAFARFDHDHWFEEDDDGKTTIARDVFDFDAPLGPLGTIADRLFLRRYMTRFLEVRMNVLKSMAEGESA